MDNEIVIKVKKGLEETVGGLGDEINFFIKKLSEEEIVAAAILYLSNILVNNKFD